MVMRRNVDKGLHAGRITQAERVPELCQDVASLDELVEEVVVCGGVWKEILTAGQSEGEKIDEEGDNV